MNGRERQFGLKLKKKVWKLHPQNTRMVAVIF